MLRNEAYPALSGWGTMLICVCPGRISCAGMIYDRLYTVPIQLGTTTTVVNLDTGSSDLWVISSNCVADACAKTSGGAAPVPIAGLRTTGANVTMNYGDSTTGTFASGPIAMDTVGIAGVAIDNQLFAAVSDTTNTVVEFGAAGIFGLGFPSESQVQGAQVSKQFGATTTTDHFIASSYADGPLISRIAQSGALDMPMFSISLQSATIDISGTGALTLGALPDGVDNSSITWVPVRLYTEAEGGLAPPTFAPNEVYPLRWEIEIDGVFLDGQELPASTIPATGNVSSTKMSALIDTGNSILRGPSDVVNNILSTVSPDYSAAVANSATLACATAHNLSFQIGGQMFPIDPRDLIGPETANNAETCVFDNIVATDPPSVGALFRWSLGDPFMKSNLVVFHYGNLTNPSVDPPRIGFLSQVPADAATLLTQAVQDAVQNGGNFESTLVIAPTASAEFQAQAEVTVVPTSASAQAAALTGSHTPATAAATQAATTESVTVNAAATTVPSAKPSNGTRRLGLWDPWLLVLGAAALSVSVAW
ncbi:aspartic peptidase domain-containing protein [Mycena maculata]|uniref:Aspartic peptidase domain-containing protein n=1 Tax=Mycena maculata TaxID=230809 RepID=A0AAD7MZK7_9AGAR|nr:aspartic peptidase domain-containing protein [Mycena maculata]